MDNIQLAKMLLANGNITTSDFKAAVTAQKENPSQDIGRTLVEMNKITEDEYYNTVSKLVRIPYRKKLVIGNQDVIKNVPERVARRCNAVPIAIESGKLVIALSNPWDIETVEEIKFMSGKEITTVLATDSAIQAAIDEQYSNASAKLMAQDINEDKAITDSQAALQDIDNRIDNTPIVKLVNTLVFQAYAKKASDIHIEPFKDYMLIRMRVDGDLQEYLKLNILSHANIVTRIKILAGMNIAEKRVPLDGRFEYSFEGISVDIRVSTLPTTYGEKVVMRLLGTALGKEGSLENLGMLPDNAEKFLRICHAPNGVILVTGPTGSGKSTTLYTVLQDLNKPTVNVTTVEDPVEKHVDGINQVQVNQKAGMTFAAALRSILRQDPDVVMIGEIRDYETAEITMRAAITGHVVLSTLHTNDSVATISRLIDMGVEPYLVASAVNGILAQRLVKILCPYCKKKVPTSSYDRAVLTDESITEVFAPVGCQNCNNTGYSGRTAVHEVLEMTGTIREMVTASKPEEDIRALVQADGMVFLDGNLRELIVAGKTSIEEYKRLVYSTM